MPTTDRSTCQIRDLVAFGPGYHKGSLYSPDRCTRIASNFADLKSYRTANVKLGHDHQQRFALSLGFPATGRVIACRALRGGYLSFDLDDVPADVGGEINAGRLASASIELASRVRDPRDPSRVIPGDVLTGCSLLGEEPPAVWNYPPELKARTKPRATFSDGSLVPANKSAARWLTAMMSVMGADVEVPPRTMMFAGSESPVVSVSFASMTPIPSPKPTSGVPKMEPEKLKALLTALGIPPEKVAVMVSAYSEVDSAMPGATPSGVEAERIARRSWAACCGSAPAYTCSATSTRRGGSGSGTGSCSRT